jgi:hypothetical protein
VFFPFISAAEEFLAQVRRLCTFRFFLSQFQEHFLARIPAFIAEAALARAKRSRSDLRSKLQGVDETTLDWAYPSYDISLAKLMEPHGGKLKTYRRKIHKFNKRGIEVIRPIDMNPCEVRSAVRKVTKGWIQAKFGSGEVSHGPGVRRHMLRDLIGCYRTLAGLNTSGAIALDGLVLKRWDEYVAFSFWERPSVGEIVPCLAALPGSYEPGLSEYLYHRIADCLLQDRRYQTICIGGSETTSLDQFKKKLDPIDSHSLRTIKLHL